ncbi:unnamed protein product [Knipowitschia caucasica]
MFLASEQHRAPVLPATKDFRSTNYTSQNASSPQTTAPSGQSGVSSRAAPLQQQPLSGPLLSAAAGGSARFC